MFWRRQAHHFKGSTTPNVCTYVSSESGKRIIFNCDLLLTEEALWISDRAQDEGGNQVFGHPTSLPQKNRKARRFECCMTAMQRDGEWTLRRGLEIFDRGGMLWLETEEEAPQQVGIKMRNECWPYGDNRPSPVLHGYRPNEDCAVFYAWADPSAQRIGINLRWMQASCTLAAK